jgi:hypothetical protein
MFMAAKYEEIYSIKLNTVYNKIGHQKIDILDFLLKEALIVNTLNF